ncbi:hypothetical protein SRHO_G00248990 [Serrasalmus rhombeus]
MPARIVSEQREFLLDLFSHVKNYETQTGRNVLPALQPVYQSAPAEWIINLSERKSSLFLEVLKLQTVKKPVELTGWSDEESEVRSFLQCLPYISQLRWQHRKLPPENRISDHHPFIFSSENSLSSVRNQSFNAYSRHPKASAPQRSATITAAKGSRKTPLLPGHLKIQRPYQERSLSKEGEDMIVSALGDSSFRPWRYSKLTVFPPRRDQREENHFMDQSVIQADQDRFEE